MFIWANQAIRLHGQRSGGCCCCGLDLQIESEAFFFSFTFFLSINVFLVGREVEEGGNVALQSYITSLPIIV